jgi:ParB family chromosome partitioning protein
MTSGLHYDYDIAEIQGADYNPRRIDDEAITKLQRSLKVVGCAKPIIVRGRTIVAGHQRTRALRAMGVKTAPVYLLPTDANTYDEVRFNQLHNGTDLDAGDENARVKGGLPGRSGFVEVAPADLEGNLKARGANIRNEIMSLVLKYGPWGACVANEAGEIFHAAQYALSCKILNKPCLVYVVPREVEAEARELLGAQYGVFSYDNLPRNTFIQTFAQMFRLRGSARDNKSPTYEEHVIPWLARNKEARVLDFGCGQGDYVAKLSGAGYRIQGMELFRRARGTDAIDVRAVNKMVDALIKSLGQHGRFDAVVCDYVMNSVDSQQAEDDVLACLAAFCKPGGIVFFSGRLKERVEFLDTMRSVVATKNHSRYVEFLDENNLTALYRKGEWFYQKFHSKADVQKICDRYGFTLQKRTESATAWQVATVNGGTVAAAAVANAVDREFNMPLNRSGRRLGRNEDVKAAILCLL